MAIPVIGAREFATRFALGPRQFAWFLGAGASAGAGIPTGFAMIAEFKTELFCRANGLPRREVDSADPIWVARIDQHFAKQGTLPPAGDPTEYAKAFEAVYPTASDRRAYIDQQVRVGRPSYAHRVLAGLLVSGELPCVFTTNFDTLVESSAAIALDLLSSPKGKHLTVAAIDSAERAERCLREQDWPLLAKIHGDFKSEELKNIQGELQQQDVHMRHVLIECCKRFGLVVVGYSGRDASAMQALADALEAEDAFPGGIYWMSRASAEPLPAVQIFLEQARARGIDAYRLDCQNFDELAGDLVESVALEDVLKQHIRSAQPEPVLRLVALPTHEARKDPVLRCSAIRITVLPEVARKVVLGKAAPIKLVHEHLREAKAKVVVAQAGNHLAAFGSDGDILSALASLDPKLDGVIALDPGQHSWASGLLYDALAKALCKGRPLYPKLKRRGHSVMISPGHPEDTPERNKRRLDDLAPLKNAYGDLLHGQVKSLPYPFTEALKIRLEQMAGDWWCVFDPFTHVDLPPQPRTSEGRPIWTPNPAGDWLRERWARRYNDKWSAIIDAWSSILSGEARALWLEPGVGIDAVFDVGAVSAWSVPSHDHAYFHRAPR